MISTFCSKKGSKNGSKNGSKLASLLGVMCYAQDNSIELP